MGRMIFDPVWAEKKHRTWCCELIYVVRGEVIIETGRRRQLTATGDMVLIPAGCLHRDVFDLSKGLEVFMVFFAWKAARCFWRTVTPGVNAPLHLPVGRDAARLIEELQRGLASGLETDRIIGRIHLLAILGMFLKHYGAPVPGTDATENYGRRRRQGLMLKARKYLQEHLAEEISLDNIARDLQVSSYYLSHVFSCESNFRLFEYLNQLRMERAMKLLKEGRLNVSEVAYAAGFNDCNYFSRVFHRHFGISPRACRRTC